MDRLAFFSLSFAESAPSATSSSIAMWLSSSAPNFFPCSVSRPSDSDICASTTASSSSAAPFALVDADADAARGAASRSSRCAREPAAAAGRGAVADSRRGGSGVKDLAIDPQIDDIPVGEIRERQKKGAGKGRMECRKRCGGKG